MLLTHRYGQLWHNGKRVHGHRLSWLLFRGEIPAGLCVCHSCDEPRCINPAHLFLGTRAENMADMARKRRNFIPYGNRSRLGKSHSVRLSLDDVQTIRASSLSGAELGRRFGVSRTTISQVRRGLLWRPGNVVVGNCGGGVVPAMEVRNAST